MSEAARMMDLKRLGMLPQRRIACPGCGSTNPHPINYVWRSEQDHTHFGCCVQALVERHGADPARIIKQDNPTFLAD
jgi:hypothetical protein